jgi:hypothetical protein
MNWWGTNWLGTKSRVVRRLAVLVAAIAALGVLPLPEAAIADEGPPSECTAGLVDCNPAGLTGAVDGYQIFLHTTDWYNRDDNPEAERATVVLAARAEARGSL